MPRDGLSQYAPPPGTNGITNYTIESTKYNGFVADVTQDLNLPRPIVAGGTGANNAHDALINLHGEEALQHVTNYDSFPFVSGSFASDAGATSAPNANAFAGICYVHTNPAFMALEAREVLGSGTGRLYVREMQSGVWQAWKQQAGSAADLDAAYVNVTGDQMTGNLTIANPAGANLALSKGVGAFTNTIYGMVAGVPRWSIDLGDTAPESGSNAGSDFYIRRMNDAGAQLSVPLGINRATGAMTISGTITMTGALTVAGAFIAAQIATTAPAITSGSSGTTGAYYFGNSGTKVLNYDGTTFNFNGGPLIVNSDITSYRTGAPTTGYNYFGNSGTKYLGYDGTAYTLVGGILNAPGLTSSGNIIGNGSSGIFSAQNANPNIGYYFFGLNGTKYLTYDGTNFSLVGGPLNSGAHNINSGKLTLLSPSGSTVPVGYAFGISYGGNTEFGIGMRAVSDATGYLAVAFINSAGSTVGSIGCTNAATTYNTASSAELKEDLKTFDAGNIIDQTDVYDFKWKASSERAYGVIAQQAVEVYPTAVTHTINPQNKDEEFWGVDYSRYVPVLLQELKALRARVALLEGAAARPA
jgi:hypothetical protein